MAKRYYWLKLPDGFFRQKAIKKLRKIAGGDTYTIIYLKMLLVAMKQDGRLYFEGVEATFYDELALDLDEEVENVRVTVMFLIQQDLMQLIDETEYSLSECAKMTGSESASAERMRRLRDKKASQCDIEVTEPLRIGDVENRHCSSCCYSFFPCHSCFCAMQIHPIAPGIFRKRNHQAANKIELYKLRYLDGRRHGKIIWEITFHIRYIRWKVSHHPLLYLVRITF